MMERKHNSLSLELKMKLLDEVDNRKLTGIKKKQICAKYGISSSTLSTILVRREHVAEAHAEFHPSRKRARKPAFEDFEFDKALYRWIKQNESKELSGATLLEKAKELAKEMNMEFTPDKNWLNLFKNRRALELGSSTCAMNKVHENIPMSLVLEVEDQKQAGTDLLERTTPESLQVEGEQVLTEINKNESGQLERIPTLMPIKLEIEDQSVIESEISRLDGGSPPMSLDLKVEEIDPTESQSQRWEKYDTDSERSTTPCFIQGKEQLGFEEAKAQFPKESVIRASRNRKGGLVHAQIDKALWSWIKESGNIKSTFLTGACLMEKANELAKDMNIEFTADAEWLKYFKKRTAVNFDAITIINSELSEASSMPEVWEEMLKDCAPVELEPATIEYASHCKVQIENAEEPDKIDYKIPVISITAGEAMEAVDIMQSFLESQRDSENILKLLSKVREFVKETTEKRPRQTSITDFFIKT